MQMPRVWIATISLALFFASAAPSLAQSPPEPGQSLSPITFSLPGKPEDMAYLGIDAAAKDFTLADIQADLIFLEIIGVYCPQCYRQLPLFKDVHTRIERGKLKNRVKMFSVAAGGNQPEVDLLTKTQQYPFPVLQDPDYTVHKALAEPLTPFTMLLRPDGTVLFTHLGVIEDVDSFYRTIKKLVL
ncbi:peroxiredoxin family protein [Desulfoplanes sp. PS50]